MLDIRLVFIYHYSIWYIACGMPWSDIIKDTCHTLSNIPFFEIHPLLLIKIYWGNHKF